MMPTREVVEVAEEAAAEKIKQKDTAATDRTIEVEKTDPVEDRTSEEETKKIDHAVEIEAEATMVKHVNPATTVVDVVEDPLLRVSHSVRTVEAAEEEAVKTVAEEVAEAVEVSNAAEAAPLTEKETTEA